MRGRWALRRKSFTHTMNNCVQIRQVIPSIYLNVVVDNDTPNVLPSFSYAAFVPSS